MRSFNSPGKVRSLPAKVPCKVGRATERAPWTSVMVLAVTLTASSTFNAITVWFLHPYDWPLGNTCLVNGCKMHIDCTGNGSPAIALESGVGNESFVWSRVLLDATSTGASGVVPRRRGPNPRFVT
jgi:hypothetical protein